MQYCIAHLKWREHIEVNRLNEINSLKHLSLGTNVDLRTKTEGEMEEDKV
jgi:hypothetical protein